MEELVPTYKVVLEIKSDCDVDQLKNFLSELMIPPNEDREGFRLSGVVLAAAETQSSRIGKSEQSDED